MPTIPRSAHHPWRSPASAWWTSVTLATITFLITALSSHTFADERWSRLGPGEAVMALAPLATGLMTATVTAAVVLAWRRPVVATSLLLLLVPAALVYSWSLGWWLAVVLVSVLATIRGSWFAVAPWLGAAGITVHLCRGGNPFATPIGPIRLDPTFDDYLVFWFGMLVVALVAAVTSRLVMLAARRSEVARAAAEATSVDASRRAAAATERSVVARDLHDVVAHHVSLVAVRAESAPYVLPDADPETRALFREIADDARAALTELRSALAVLDRGAGTAGGDGPPVQPAPRAPLPTGTDVPLLLARVRGAGQEVLVTDEDSLAVRLGTLDAPSGYVVYRSLQEALTNVRRHAPGAAARVRVTQTQDDAELLVSNDVGPGQGVAAPGRGLLGMAERAASLGGILVTGLEHGQFVVRLTVPRHASRDRAVVDAR